MNKKLKQLEYKETKKTAVLFITILSVYQVINVILGLISRSKESSVISDLMVIITLCSTLGVIMGAVIMLKRFYNILFSNEGLIRLAMPVKNSEHMKVNIKNALFWIYILFFILIAGAGLGEISSGDRFWGVADAFRNLATLYFFDNPTGADKKAVITIIIHVLTIAVIIANLYISCIFAIILSSRIAGKFNIIQKNGVLFICVIVIYNIKALFVNLGYKFLIYFDDLAYQYLIPLNTYTWNLLLDISCIAVYGSSAVIMYLICKKIIETKIDI